jgi:hypothetical protein
MSGMPFAGFYEYAVEEDLLEQRVRRRRSPSSLVSLAS